MDLKGLCHPLLAHPDAICPVGHLLNLPQATGNKVLVLRLVRAARVKPAAVMPLLVVALQQEQVEGCSFLFCHPQQDPVTGHVATSCGHPLGTGREWEMEALCKTSTWPRIRQPLGCLSWLFFCP